ncbi:MAG: hypothetical protein HYW07_22255 [Candidatus Latescibacteria bacterium]|nr:hypothetical protein [Candidatus Latescibacterota bacterium]
MTPEQRDENRRWAQQRIYVEHGIRRIRGWRILPACRQTGATSTGWRWGCSLPWRRPSWAWCNWGGSSTKPCPG